MAFKVGDLVWVTRVDAPYDDPMQTYVGDVGVVASRPLLEGYYRVDFGIGRNPLLLKEQELELVEV
jgi:hypothetical protein